MQRQGEEWPVAAVVLVGGNSCARWLRVGETEEGEGEQRVRERREGPPGGVRGIAVA